MNLRSIQHIGVLTISTVTLLNIVLTGANFYYFSARNTGKTISAEALPSMTQTTYVEESATIDAVKKAAPSVVSIIATKELEVYRGGRNMFPGFADDPFFRQFFGFPDTEQQPEPKTETKKTEVGGGSGFIYSKEGLVITNRHVVADTQAQYTIVLSDGTELKSEVLARDPFNDVAILQIKDAPDNLIPITVGSSEDLQVGQKLIAIGNALAKFQNTVTTGILSAKGRDIVAGGGLESANHIANLLQTDAAINSGNSGGPLINLAGQVIGINTAIAGGAEGIGFALPIDDVVTFIKNVQKNGKYVRPYLGIRHIMLDEKIAKNAGLTITEGAYIYSDIRSNEPVIMPKSPADKAGLKIGDIITQVDDTPIDAKHPLSSAIGEHGIGDTITLTVVRDGNTKKLTLKLEAYPDDSKE